jgi:hypothetical protein
MPGLHRVTRSWLSWLTMRFHPSFSPLTRFAAGMRTSSQCTAQMSCTDSRRSGVRSMPGLSIGAMKIEMPRWRLPSSPVRAASQQ